MSYPTTGERFEAWELSRLLEIPAGLRPEHVSSEAQRYRTFNEVVAAARQGFTAARGKVAAAMEGPAAAAVLAELTRLDALGDAGQARSAAATRALDDHAGQVASVGTELTWVERVAAGVRGVVVPVGPAAGAGVLASRYVVDPAVQMYAASVATRYQDTSNTNYASAYPVHEPPGISPVQVAGAGGGSPAPGIGGLPEIGPAGYPGITTTVPPGFGDPGAGGPGGAGGWTGGPAGSGAAGGVPPGVAVAPPTAMPRPGAGGGVVPVPRPGPGGPVSPGAGRPGPPWRAPTPDTRPGTGSARPGLPGGPGRPGGGVGGGSGRGVGGWSGGPGRETGAGGWGAGGRAGAAVVGDHGGASSGGGTGRSPVGPTAASGPAGPVAAAPGTARGAGYGGVPVGAGMGAAHDETHERPPWLLQDDPESIWFAGLPEHCDPVIGGPPSSS